MLICDPWPLDQHYARNPEEIFSSPFQQLALDLDNPIVLEAHIQCAADEVPITVEEDKQYFGDKLEKICRERLVRDDQGYYHCHPRYKPYPAKAVPIRNTEDDAYSIIDISDGRNAIIEEIEISRAIFTTYEGAIYMHMGRTFGERREADLEIRSNLYRHTSQLLKRFLMNARSPKSRERLLIGELVNETLRECPAV